MNNVDAKIKIYNSVGEMVKEVNPRGVQQISLSISENGVFFVVLAVNGKKITNKVIITN
jgi:hypothetical protein